MQDRAGAAVDAEDRRLATRAAGSGRATSSASRRRRPRAERASDSIVGAWKIAPSGRLPPSSCSIAAKSVAATIDVTPRSKKSSVDPDRADLEVALPDLDEPRSSSVRGATKLAARPSAPRAGSGSALRSIFPFGVSGNARARVTVGRDHVRRAASAQTNRRSALDDDRHSSSGITYAASSRPGVVFRATATTALPTAGMAREHGLDLAELDAEAADLDLVVDPAEELDRRRRRGSAPGRPSCRSGRRASRRTGRRRSAPRSGRGGRGSRARGRRRRCSSSPGTPIGTGSAARSRMYSVVFAIGRPIVSGSPGVRIARDRRPDRRLGRARTCSRARRPRSTSPSASASGSASPPQSAFSPARPGQPASSSIRQVVGVACITVAPLRSSSSASRRGSAARLCARDHDARPDEERQVELEPGDVERERRDRDEASSCASRPGRSAIVLRKFTSARCGIWTPFGFPVEPDV